MAIDFNHQISLLSAEDLNERVQNRQKYLPETVEASVAELQHRGHIFFEEELTAINDDLQTRRTSAAIGSAGFGFFNKNFKANLVTDPYAPSFFSRNAVYLFTFFCGPLFGSILLAINASKIQRGKNGIVWIVLFGIAFTTVQVAVSYRVNAGTSYRIFCGLISAYCLDHFFWSRFIGNSTFYRASSIWPPIIIAIVIGLSVSIFLLGMVQHYW